jgi:NitT/TauT family transport system substrate-binding protein
MKILLHILLILSIFPLLPAANAQAGDKPLQKLVFLPHWSPQAQFAGYYVAKEKGFYRRNGLDVEIIEGGPSRSAVEYLRHRRADIVSLWLSSALQLADEGMDIVNIGQVIQRSALVLVTKKSSGITTPEQMQGVKVALWPADFQIQPKAFFHKFGVHNRIVTTANPVNLFLRDGVEVASVMWYNEYHTLLNSGLDPEEMQLFFFDSFGLNFPEDGIYLRRETLDRNPEAVRAFVAATLEGWRYAFAHPEEAIDIIIDEMEKARVPANRVHQRWMLARMQDLFATGNKPPLQLHGDDYRQVGDIMQSAGLIRAVPDYSSFFQDVLDHAR